MYKAMYDIYLEGRIDLSMVTDSNTFTKWLDIESKIVDGEIAESRTLELDTESYVNSFHIGKNRIVTPELRMRLCDLLYDAGYYSIDTNIIRFELGEESLVVEEEDNIYKVEIVIHGTNHHYLTLILALLMSNITELDTLEVHMQGALVANLNNIDEYERVLDNLVSKPIPLDTLLINLAFSK